MFVVLAYEFDDEGERPDVYGPFSTEDSASAWANVALTVGQWDVAPVCDP